MQTSPKFWGKGWRIVTSPANSLQGLYKKTDDVGDGRYI